MQVVIRHRWLVPVDPGGTATWVRVLEHLGHSVHVDPVSGVAAVDSVLLRRRVTLHVEGGIARARAALEQELAARLRAAGADIVPAIGSRDEPPAASDAAITVTVDAVARAATVEGARHHPLASWRLARVLARALQACGRGPVRQCHVPVDTWELLPARPTGVAGPVVRVSIPAGWPVAELATALYAGLVTYFGGPRQPLSATPPVTAPGAAGAGKRPSPLPAPAGSNGHGRYSAAALPADNSLPEAGARGVGGTLAGSGAAPEPVPGGGTATGTPPPPEEALAGVAASAPPQPGDLVPADSVQGLETEPGLEAMAGPCQEAAAQAGPDSAPEPEAELAPEPEPEPVPEPADMAPESADMAPELAETAGSELAEMALELSAETPHDAAAEQPSVLPAPPAESEAVDAEPDAEPADLAVTGRGDDAEPPSPAHTRQPRRRMAMAAGLPAGVPRAVLPPGVGMAHAFAPFRQERTAPHRPGYPAAPSPSAPGAGVAGRQPAGLPGRQPVRAVPSFTTTGRKPGSLRPFR